MQDNSKYIESNYKIYYTLLAIKHEIVHIYHSQYNNLCTEYKLNCKYIAPEKRIDELILNINSKIKQPKYKIGDGVWFYLDEDKDITRLGKIDECWWGRGSNEYWYAVRTTHGEHMSEPQSILKSDDIEIPIIIRNDNYCHKARKDCFCQTCKYAHTRPRGLDYGCIVCDECSGSVKICCTSHSKRYKGFLYGGNQI